MNWTQEINHDLYKNISKELLDKIKTEIQGN